MFDWLYRRIDMRVASLIRERESILSTKREQMSYLNAKISILERTIKQLEKTNA